MEENLETLRENCTRDPVIEELLNWLKNNLPPDIEEEIIFKKVHVVQKVFENLIALTFQEYYNFANSDAKHGCDSLEEGVDQRISVLKEYAKHSELKLKKTEQLKKASERQELIKARHDFISSIKLDGTMDLIKRYDRYMPKKQP